MESSGKRAPLSGLKKQTPWCAVREAPARGVGVMVYLQDATVGFKFKWSQRGTLSDLPLAVDSVENVATPQCGRQMALSASAGRTA